MTLPDPSCLKNFSDEEKQEIWERYWAGDDSARFELHEAYLPLILYFVKHFERKLASTADKDGLLSEAFFGLDEAIRNYHFAGNRFETFASIRIRGSILDAYRAADWLPRGLRSTWRKCFDASDVFLMEHHREPTVDELSAILNMSDKDIVDALIANTNAYTTHFDSPVMEFESGEVTLGEVLPDASTFDSHTAYEMESLMSALLDCLENELDDSEQLVIFWKYIQGVPLVTIAERFKLPQQAVSSIHKVALSKLKETLVAASI